MGLVIGSDMSHESFMGQPWGRRLDMSFKTYLYSGLREINFHGNLLPCVNVRVVSFLGMGKVSQTICS